MKSATNVLRQIHVFGNKEELRLLEKSADG